MWPFSPYWFFLTMSMECFSIYVLSYFFEWLFIVLLEEVLHILVSCTPRYFILFLGKVNGSSLMIWLFVCYWCVGMLVVFAHWFCILRLAELLISLRRFWAEMMGSSKYTVMSSANRDNLTSSFPNWIPFISFSCLVALARTFNTMLNRSGERGHPCLVLVFKGNASRFCPFSMILWVCHK